MKKVLIFLAILFVLLPNIMAISLEIEEEPINNVMIKELNNPAMFKLAITNLGPTDTFEFYNLLGFQMSPTNPITISSNKTENIQLIIYPREGVEYKQYYTLNYFIRAKDKSEIAEKATIKILSLADVFEIGTEDIDLESNFVRYYIHNKEKIDFPKLDIEIDSPFFKDSQTLSLTTNERKNFTATLIKENFKNLEAGFYTLTAKVKTDNAEANVEGNINFIEKDLIEKKEDTSGFIITKKETIIENKGNTHEKVSTTIKNNIISRLFTSVNPEPQVVDRQGFEIFYTWNDNLAPGDTLNVVVKTNWLFPLIFIALVVFIVVLIKQYSKRDLLLKKKVKFLKAKGGEFALKVSIFVRAKEYMENVNIIDRLPPLVKLYNKFGREPPKSIERATRSLKWSFEKLEKGEIRVLTYIIYSKVGVIGKFALPQTKAFYDKEEKTKESSSNKAFFVAAPKKNDELRE